MAIDFPDSPADGQEYAFGSTVWVYGSGKWNLKPVVAGGSGGSSSVAFQPEPPASPNVGDVWVDSNAVVPESNLVSSTTITSIWTGTQAAYDLIDPKIPTTLYVIVD